MEEPSGRKKKGMEEPVYILHKCQDFCWLKTILETKDPLIQNMATQNSEALPKESVTTKSTSYCLSWLISFTNSR